jgi:hypothetical protein
MSKYLNEAYTLRIPAEIKQKLAEIGKENNRSLNAEILLRLEQSLQLDKAHADGKIVTTQESYLVLENNILKMIKDLTQNLFNEGVTQETVVKAFKAIKTEDNQNKKPAD